MSFARPTLQDLIDRTEQDLLAGLGLGAILPRSVEYAVGRAQALLAHGMHGHLDWAAQQLFPDTAEAEYLDQWAAVWGVTRKQAAIAVGQVVLFGTDTTVVPAGTQLRNSEGALVSTDADVTIAAGVAVADVTALVPGAAANTPEGAVLTVLSPIAGVNTQVLANVGGIAGGADAESDADLRARLLTRIQQPPAGGAESDYLLWALAVPGVTRAWVRPQWYGPGTVGVLFVLDDQVGTIVPNQAKVDEVQAYIDERRPVTAQAIVVAPQELAVDVTIQLTPNTLAVQQAVQDALTDLFAREAEPGASFPLSKISEAISTAPGETSHVLVAPVADVVPTNVQLPVLGTVSFQ